MLHCKESENLRDIVFSSIIEELDKELLGHDPLPGAQVSKEILEQALPKIAHILIDRFHREYGSNDRKYREIRRLVHEHTENHQSVINVISKHLNVNSKYFKISNFKIFNLEHIERICRTVPLNREAGRIRGEDVSEDKPATQFSVDEMSGVGGSGYADFKDNNYNRTRGNQRTNPSPNGNRIEVQEFPEPFPGQQLIVKIARALPPDRYMFFGTSLTDYQFEELEALRYDLRDTKERHIILLQEWKRCCQLPNEDKQQHLIQALRCIDRDDFAIEIEKQYQPAVHVDVVQSDVPSQPEIAFLADKLEPSRYIIVAVTLGLNSEEAESLATHYEEKKERTIKMLEYWKKQKVRERTLNVKLIKDLLLQEKLLDAFVDKFGAHRLESAPVHYTENLDHYERPRRDRNTHKAQYGTHPKNRQATYYQDDNQNVEEPCIATSTDDVNGNLNKESSQYGYVDCDDETRECVLSLNLKTDSELQLYEEEKLQEGNQGKSVNIHQLMNSNICGAEGIEDDPYKALKQDEFPDKQGISRLPCRSHHGRKSPSFPPQNHKGNNELNYISDNSEDAYVCQETIQEYSSKMFVKKADAPAKIATQEVDVLYNACTKQMDIPKSTPTIDTDVLQNTSTVEIDVHYNSSTIEGGVHSNTYTKEMDVLQNRAIEEMNVQNNTPAIVTDLPRNTSTTEVLVEVLNSTSITDLAGTTPTQERTVWNITSDEEIVVSSDTKSVEDIVEFDHTSNKETVVPNIKSKELVIAKNTCVKPSRISNNKSAYKIASHHSASLITKENDVPTLTFANEMDGQNNTCIPKISPANMIGTSDTDNLHINTWTDKKSGIDIQIESDMTIIPAPRELDKLHKKLAQEKFTTSSSSDVSIIRDSEETEMPYNSSMQGRDMARSCSNCVSNNSSIKGTGIPNYCSGEECQTERCDGCSSVKLSGSCADLEKNYVAISTEEHDITSISALKSSENKQSEVLLSNHESANPERSVDLESNKTHCSSVDRTEQVDTSSVMNTLHGIDHGLDQGLDHGIDHGMDHGIDHGIDHGMDLEGGTGNNDDVRTAAQETGELNDTRLKNLSNLFLPVFQSESHNSNNRWCVLQ